ncbi:MAG TPA: hypothetical protein DEB17_08460 [Chlorobaculum sp.]|uniref:Uncharacterized protein n=1 Tax=Chlorobaculum tepidum (strain ATCC 49652 / DSM 12025 / NBRC 103806 / TLS) TaxID=194439 RepID=Q8KF10_CHLTE|nr:hypothetical protein CT0522 [Chlorobaculum tepidum TLS]HBU24002.1 hypothetical protein [Chlorobaculum sp.]
MIERFLYFVTNTLHRHPATGKKIHNSYRKSPHFSSQQNGNAIFNTL